LGKILLVDFGEKKGSGVLKREPSMISMERDLVGLILF
jgi:hypothetical protein